MSDTPLTGKPACSVDLSGEETQAPIPQAAPEHEARIHAQITELEKRYRVQLDNQELVQLRADLAARDERIKQLEMHNAILSEGCVRMGEEILELKDNIKASLT